MHAEAHAWVARHADDRPLTALDIGGRNINGTCRALFPAATWTVLDIAAGPGVDVVADAATWKPDRQYDLVLCTEVFEHAERWRFICATAFLACAPGGRLIVTMAGPGRAVHNSTDGGPELRPGEYYANVVPYDLQVALTVAGWSEIQVDQLGPDVRATARRPTEGRPR